MSYVRTAPWTFLLVVGLTAVFIAELATGIADNPLGLLRDGAIPGNARFHGEYWRLFTYSLLHLNITHLVTNVALLAWVGRIVERRVGGGRLLVIYVASVLLAGLAITLSYALEPAVGVSVGASGGVFGLLATSIVLVFRRDMASFGQDRGVRLGLLGCLALAIGMSFLPGVSFAGHVGGMVTGIVLGLIVPPRAAELPEAPEAPVGPEDPARDGVAA